ncbi:hypothetical protein CHU95_02685 [Niveispirillum lacus]|uniref:Acyltransferase 3 domain-containing protein n=1 Tax=Niveispirillum lacus TaxID=1981099 RepID=A0A255Z663_9PROT|nr:acyltransferase [Niveispirillum lacus]OYQ36911.1 hypothetical protein CHU95_02685 [Niveispirillum lacus]
MSEDRLRVLDGIRGIAALMVLVYHLPLIVTPQATIPDWALFTAYGGSGVKLFFVLSAFSLCLTMPAHLCSGAPLFSFFTKRFLRIAPLFYLVTVYQLLSMQIAQGQLPPFDILLANFTLLFNLYPKAADCLIFAGWTIGVEVLFYLMFPALYRSADTLGKRAALFIGSFAAFPIFMGLLSYLPVDSAVAERYSILTIFLYLPAFAAGMLVFPIYQRYAQQDGAREIGLILLSVAFALYAFLASGRLIGILPPAHWETFCFGFFVLGAALRGFPALIDRPLSFVGRISYSVYLLHGPIIIMANPLFQWMNGWEAPPTVRFTAMLATALCLVLPLSLLSFNLVEQPSIHLSKKLIKHYTATRHTR